MDVWKSFRKSYFSEHLQWLLVRYWYCICIIVKLKYFFRFCTVKDSFSFFKGIFFIPQLFYKIKVYIFNDTAWKVSDFGVFLARVFPHLDWIRSDTLLIHSECRNIQTRITANSDNFHAVSHRSKYFLLIFDFGFLSIFLVTNVS